MRRRDDGTTEAMRMSKGLWALIVVALVIIADQSLKIWVKTSFYLGEDLPVTGWFQLKFIENNGMAFGLELWSKVALTFFRIAAVCFLGWVLWLLRRSANVRLGTILAVALITAGAAGNIFDCVFYGRLFNDPWPPQVAVMFPPGGGYAGWFEGKVVDMLYFPLFTFTWPDWMPGVGGGQYEFFQYIFNLADSSICVGVFLLIIFFSADFNVMVREVAPSIPFTAAWLRRREKERDDNSPKNG